MLKNPLVNGIEYFLKDLIEVGALRKKNFDLIEALTETSNEISLQDDAEVRRELRAELRLEVYAVLATAQLAFYHMKSLKELAFFGITSEPLNYTQLKLALEWFLEQLYQICDKNSFNQMEQVDTLQRYVGELE